MSDQIKLTPEQVNSLIQLRCDKYKLLFSGKKFDCNSGWKKITRDLGIREDMFKKVKKKWENLLQKYKTLKKPSSGISTEDGEVLPTTWQYFDAIDKYYAEKHIIQPVCLVSSINSTTSPDESTSALQQSTSGACIHTEPSSPSSSPMSATEYFGSETTASTTPRKRPNDEILSYMKKRDKKIISQNKMLIKLLKKSLESEGTIVSDVSDNSDDD